jgi:hypothetical protein
MTGDDQEWLVLRDSDVELYLLPRMVLNQARVAQEHRADVLALIEGNTHGPSTTPRRSEGDRGELLLGSTFAGPLIGTMMGNAIGASSDNSKESAATNNFRRIPD